VFSRLCGVSLSFAVMRASRLRILASTSCGVTMTTSHSGSVRKSRKKISVKISSDIFDRYLYSFLYFFTDAGYRVYVKAGMKFLVSLFTNKYSRQLLYRKGIRFGFREKSNVDFRMSDSDDAAVFLNGDYFDESPRHAFHVPMAMHPLVYRHGYHERCTEMAGNTDRKIKLFFAGNLDSRFYRDPDMMPLFKTLTRLDLYDALTERFGDSVCVIEDVQQMSRCGEKNIIMLDTTRTRIPQERFLEFLADSTFFLALPGFDKPLCHNTVEAMSVGCIPILEYADLFKPPLEHGVNCLRFGGREGFVEAVREASGLDGKRVAVMRAEVLQYYERYLSPSGVIRLLEECSDGLQEIRLLARDSVERLKRRLLK
jgi:hypothetical protein